MTVLKDAATQPRMFYFGPWDSPGHYIVDERGYSMYGDKLGTLPWTLGQLDGGLQPHFADCAKKRGHYYRCCNCPSGAEGPALLHHKDGWTALAFWDRTVDKRGACNSVYMAEGTYTFDQMVAMARERFAVRWNKMAFQVTLYEEAQQ
jgi:hypothetical protein